MLCETVKIEADTKQGYCIINKSDFDEKEHLLYEEKPAKKEPKKASKKAD